jgi:hemerythrin-like domain-containing protein
MNATQTLQDEHRGIEKMLGIMDAALTALEAGRAVPPEVFTQAADFFRGFVDRCHHAKEEGALFPALEQRGIPREGGPVGVMLAEHEQGRAHVQALAAAAARYASGDASAASALLEHGRGYGALLRQHIAKEDGVLFVMAQRVLDDQTDAALTEAFERVEREQTGPGEHERYHAMIDKLERESAIW